MTNVTCWEKDILQTLQVYADGKAATFGYHFAHWFHSLQQTIVRRAS